MKNKSINYKSFLEYASELFPEEKLNKGLNNYYSYEKINTMDLFGEGFINFGYYKDIVKLDMNNRIKASRNMYDLALNLLEFEENERVIELGCGLGMGANYIFQKYPLLDYFCYDLVNEHLNLTRLATKNSLKYVQGDLYKLPFKDELFNKILSIEVLQHIENIDLVLKQMSDKLKTGGKIYLSFFLRLSKNNNCIEKSIPTVRDKIDYLHYIGDFLFLLDKHNLKIMSSIAIGEHVWYGFDEWIQTTVYRNSWNRNWYRLYLDKQIDYFSFLITK